MKKNYKFIGIDLFAGAGGLSLGAQMAGIDVVLAVEKDPNAAKTYAHNHPKTKLIIDDVKNLNDINISDKKDVRILFGGPPCQGFSTSNQRTRTKDNPNNWLFREIIRIAKKWKPDWVLIENVKGIIETEKGLFYNSILDELSKLGYTCTANILCASCFGVPQTRTRFFMIASQHGIKVNIERPSTYTKVTVKDALFDLPSLPNGANFNFLKYRCSAVSNYAKSLRGKKKGCTGHLVTKNNPNIIERYKHIPQGGNWRDIPELLMRNYTNTSKCHTGIYHRLSPNEPSIVLGNYRKNMLVHPWEDRGLSVREAARLQSFPDWYDFYGSLGYQQQQVGNAVPPLLAKHVFESIIKYHKNI